MRKADVYKGKLKDIDDCDTFLMEESGLPGPRANLELVEAVAAMGSEATFLRYISYNLERAPVNSKEEFLALCGTVGLGRLIKEGRKEYFETLKKLASDSRWRIREGVAMALQLFGENNMTELLHEMWKWVDRGHYERRAAAAALCEPKLLHDRESAIEVLQILDKITEYIEGAENWKNEDFIALKKGMAYCWSVAICAVPENGKALLEKWLHSHDKDIIWILKENLKKSRLLKLDSFWAKSCLNKLA